MKKAWLIRAYLKYLWVARNKHHVHSPFVFEFITRVLEDRRSYYAFEEIEMLRTFLLHTHEVIEVEDMGAGSHSMHSSRRRISDIASTNLISKRFGRLLFRLADHFQAKKILELGTSLGISTLYLAKADHTSKVISLEGSKSIAAVAEQNFRKTACSNIDLITGEFSTTLKSALQKLKIADLIFIDGNHRRTPTIEYFETCLHHCGENSIIVFDDIHWSREMEEAWKTISSHERVTLSLDLFFKGIVFFRSDFHIKQHFVLRW